MKWDKSNVYDVIDRQVFFVAGSIDYVDCASWNLFRKIMIISRWDDDKIDENMDNLMLSFNLWLVC